MVNESAQALMSGVASSSSSAPHSNGGCSDSWEQLTRRKQVKDIMKEVEQQIEDDAQGGQTGLKKCLTRMDIIFYGVGSTVGAGIFVITGQGALSAGPAVVLSFVIAAICCLFSAFSYAEFAARVPVSGSAYTFAYVCIGELAAWFVGWNLTLEYAISAAAVARGFSSNMILFCNQIGTPLPYWLVDVKLFGLIDHASPLSLILCLLCTAVLLVGVKESARVNMVITILNVTCILFIVILGSIHIDPQNWVTSDPHRPIPATCVGSGTGYFPCGFNGVLTGAAQVFFSFIGFDSVTTLAEELPDPKRDIPFGVISTLVIASILYTASSLVVTGMLPWNALDPNTPLASAFSSVGVNWATTIISAVTVTALAVNTLCSLFGQPRIFFRMAKDGLLFSPFARLHPTTQAPLWGTVISGVGAGIIATCMGLDALSEMISIGTLMAFTTVCLGVVILRYQAPPSQPSRPFYLLLIYLVLATGLAIGLRNYKDIPFYALIFLGILTCIPIYLISKLERFDTPLMYECPWVPVLPLMGVFSNLYLICSLNVWSYVRMVGWTFVGMLIYFGYGMKHSQLNMQHSGTPSVNMPLKYDS